AGRARASGHPRFTLGARAPVPVTRTRAGRVALVTTVLAAAVACATVPVTGRRQVILLSEGEERQMGLSSYQEVLKKSRLSSDAVATEQVRRVGRRIADATGRAAYPG